MDVCFAGPPRQRGPQPPPGRAAHARSSNEQTPVQDDDHISQARPMSGAARPGWGFHRLILVSGSCTKVSSQFPKFWKSVY